MKVHNTGCGGDDCTQSSVYAYDGTQYRVCGDDGTKMQCLW